MNKLETIKNNDVYKRIIKDSFGGLMYNVANQYDAEELLSAWNSLTDGERESAGGIMKGAMNFLKYQEERK